MNFQTLRFNLIIFLLLAILQIQTGFANPLNDKLEKARAYQYNDSRLVLSRIDSIIVSMLNNGRSNAEIEDHLLPFLTKDTSIAFKQFLCEKLSLVGGVNSIDPLVQMLSEPDTYDMALFALSRIPDAKVSASLREKCPHLISKSKIGVIQTLGLRHDPKSVNLLSGYINHNNSDISSAAISALGNIGSPAALQALNNAAAKEKQPRNSVLQHARLQSAAKSEQTDPDLAIGVYKSLLSSQYVSIKMGACRRLFNAQPDQFTARMNHFIEQQDIVLITAGLQWMQDTESPCSVQEMKSIYSQLSSAHQIMLLTSLQEIDNDIYLPVAMKALDSQHKSVRNVAFDAIVELGNASIVDELVNRSWSTRSDL